LAVITVGADELLEDELAASEDELLESELAA
jgi:hypothetical protein